MLAWLAASRLPAMAKAGIDLRTIVGGRGADLEGVIPDSVNWKSHNYAHLMEQPTLFYATAIILALVGAGDGINLRLAGPTWPCALPTAWFRRSGTAWRCA